MGLTRHTKIHYEGSPDDNPDKRLYNFYTLN